MILTILKWMKIDITRNIWFLYSLNKTIKLCKLKRRNVIIRLFSFSFTLSTESFLSPSIESNHYKLFSKKSIPMKLMYIVFWWDVSLRDKSLTDNRIILDRIQRIPKRRLFIRINHRYHITTSKKGCAILFPIKTNTLNKSLNHNLLFFGSSLLLSIQKSLLLPFKSRSIFTLLLLFLFIIIWISLYLLHSFPLLPFLLTLLLLSFLPFNRLFITINHSFKPSVTKQDHPSFSHLPLY